MDHRLLESIIDGVNRHKLPPFPATFILSNTLISGTVIPIDEIPRAMSKMSLMSLEDGAKFVSEAQESFIEGGEAMYKVSHIHIENALVAFGNFEQRTDYISIPLQDARLWFVPALDDGEHH